MLPSPRLVVLAVELPVDGGPEVEIDSGGSGRGEALGQQDPEHVLGGVRRPRRAQAALPPVAPGRSRSVLARYSGQAESPAALPQEDGDGAGLCPLLGRQVIGSHELDREPRQYALAAVLAPVQHHPAKGEVVVGSRDQPPSRVWESRRAAPLAVLGPLVGPQWSGFRG